MILLYIFLIYTTYATREFEGCGRCSITVSFMNENKSYFVVDYLKSNWYIAFEHCSYIGMQLITIESDQELRVIRNVVLQSEFYQFWTSGMRINSKYVWMSSGVDFTEMTSLWGGPNRTSRCVSIDSDFDYKLHSTSCQSEYNFICEAISCNNY